MTAVAQLAGGASAFTPAEPRYASRPSERISVSVCSDEQGRSWAEVIDELLALRQLEEDWDGQGAEAPDPTVVDSALRIALELRGSGVPTPDRVVAGVNGTVFFEWHDPVEYLEIEVSAPGRAEGRRVNTDTNLVEEFTL